MPIREARPQAKSDLEKRLEAVEALLQEILARLAKQGI